MDLIDITGIKGIKDFGQITEAMVQDGTGVDIALGGSDMLTIQDITIDKLTAVDFAYWAWPAGLVPHSISRLPAKPGRRSTTNPAAPSPRRTKPAAA
jgi:hypothetical protein